MHRHLLPVVSALAAVALLGCPGPGPEGVSFEVTADSASDFGTAVVGTDTAELTFTVANATGGTSGKIAITLEGADAAAYRLSTDGCSGTTLPKGGTCPVGVVFSPRSEGAKPAVLVARDSSGKGQLTLAGQAVTRAVLQASPGSVNFGLIASGGSSADSTLTITNGGSQPTGTLAVTLGGAGAAQFTKPSDACDTKALAAAGSCQLKVRFAPSGLGAQAAAVTITATPGGTVVIPLAGTGGSPATLVINPTSKDYGTVNVGTQTADTTFTVTNTGSVNATNLAVALTGATGDYVKSADTCNGLATLAPGGGANSCTVKVAFKPASFGTKGLTVTVTGRVASSSSTTQVSVSPTGVGQQSFAVTVTRAGTGSGTVAGGAISCGSTCTTNVTAAASPGSISLTATPAPGSVFSGWTGDCAAQNPSSTCTLTVDAAKNAGAGFDLQRFSLTPVVSALPGAGGRITSSDALIDCSGASCTPVSYDFNTTVHLTAAAAPGSTFTGWSGDCSGTGATCDVLMTQARAATANFVPDANYAFVTSTAYTLSELALKVDPGGALTPANVVGGADVACGERALAAGLPGTFTAWLASSGGSATSRLGTARGWLRTDGLPFADQLPGDVFYPLGRDEAGAAAPAFPNGSPDVLTNADASGAAQGSCSDLTSDTVGTATLGDPSAGSVAWTQWSANTGCAGPFRLYCLGTSATATVSAPTIPAGAKRMFVTGGTFTPGLGGIAAAHALCQTEATAALLPGTYQALLATSTASAGSLFTTTGAPVARPDGVLVAAHDTDLLAAASVLLAPVERDAAGAVVSPTLAWTGTQSATGLDAAFTCTDWTSTSGNGDLGETASAARLYNVGDVDACGVAHRVFCLQE